MEFEWDEEKHQGNLRKHGLDFADAHKLFMGPVFTFEDHRFPYDEQRFIGIGMLEDLVVVIAFTEPRDDVLRPISMRKATKNEERKYYNRIAH
jgi:uncharacterized DUF497 family protein